jgi:diacylglycerol O-acyltransferase / wax synthase
MREYSGEPVNGVDTAWLCMDRPTNLMIITALAVVQDLDFNAFRQVVAQRLLKFKRFRKRPVERSGLYFWETDAHFDLDAHVRRAALAGKGDRAELQRVVSELACTAFDSTKPLWQFHYLENYDGRAAVVMRVHHCYADGMALMAVFGALTDATAVIPNMQCTAEAANEDEPEDHQPWQVYQQLLDAALQVVERYTQFSLKISEESLHLLRDPAAVLPMGQLLLNVVGEAARLAAMPSDPRTCLKGVLGISKTCVWSEPLPLARFKRLGLQLGCSVNDVLLSCVAGLLGDHLSRVEPVSEGMEVRATIPVNIRLPATDNESTQPPIGNHFGTVFMPLPVGIKNPVERIYRVKHEMQALRRSLQPDISHGLLATIGLLPGRLLQPAMDLFSGKSSLVLSNVPGARETRFIAGGRIDELMFWVPQAGDIALGISLLSYAGQVQVGLIVDTRVISAPQRLVERFEQELRLHELKSGVAFAEEPDASNAPAPRKVT